MKNLMPTDPSKPAANSARTDALIEAACSENPEEADRLLAEDPTLADSNIHAAAATGKADVVGRLLREDPGLATRRGGPENWEPLIYTCFSRSYRRSSAAADGLVRTARTLLAHGADANASLAWEGDPNIRLPALWAASCVSNHPALVRALLEAGANPDDGESVYHAAEKNYRDCLQVLREFGANFSAVHPHWNNTPLYFLFGHHPGTPAAAPALEGIRWLLEHGADPNVPSYEIQGRPIHLAAIHGWPIEAFELLHRRGADLTAQRADGRTAYSLAARHGQTAILEWLDEHGGPTPLNSVDEFFAACGKGDEPSVRAVMSQQPALISSLLPEDRAVLITAAAQGKREMVRLLLLAGIPVDSFGDGGTPLHFAAWFGELDTVRLLLAHSAPLEINDQNYQATPLGWVCHGSQNCANPGGNYPGVAEALLAADACIRPELGGSPAVNAVLERYRAIRNQK